MHPEYQLVDDEDHLPSEPEEVGLVLAALRTLWAMASSPVVRTCLEEAHDDIAHLVGGGTYSEDQAEAA